ncbi:hypothetical protein [Accumulibacter sp.]|uniref:hypothetical protein n=1 Tax=Accumulibacter sp. TaxID=2053492 RepID=UPI0026269236|nr:hypothetical protein [Accumulibacter sp.]
MPRVWFREKHPGEGVFIIDEYGMSTPCKATLEGMKEHISSCFSAVFPFFKIRPGDFLAIDGVTSRVSNKFKEGAELIRLVPEHGSLGDALNTLSDMLELSLWYLAASLGRLDLDHIEAAVYFHTCSVDILARFETSLAQLAGESEAREKGLLVDPVENGRKGAIVRNAKMEKVKERVLELYSEGTWPSMREASKKLLPVALERGSAVGFKLAEGNAERTVYDWIRKFAKDKAIFSIVHTVVCDTFSRL